MVEAVHWCVKHTKNPGYLLAGPRTDFNAVGLADLSVARQLR
jgi:hypothetical protein